MIVLSQVAGVLPKVYPAVEPSCLGESDERFLVALGSLLVHANHLASAARAQQLEVLLSNLKIPPVIFCIWLFRPGRVVWVFSHHNIGTEYLCLRRLAALCLDQFVEAVEA